ncbi:MAG TPA: hypothetical protein PLK09_12980, partial [Verrucomicrobiota bacterium]|nr:hypothetical protein [Verrucomicrobiota bacterium]HPW82004.1 hypothetical protein [Verrucomicrobiota bacterium]HQA42184.1 hypothetical protein [Verrucomicrobiota bacterium]
MPTIYIEDEDPGQSWILGFFALISTGGRLLGGCRQTICRCAWNHDQPEIAKSLPMIGAGEGNRTLAS